MGKEIKKCSIICGAPNVNIEFIKNNIDKNSYIIAADSGYLKLIKIGIMPNLIMGDFDSSPKPDLDCDIISLPVEKDYSDTFYCVRYAVELGFNYIDIYAAIGNRFDHTYSNVLCLNYCLENNVYANILDDKNRISLIKDKITFKKNYDYFSIFAYLHDCKGVKIKGAYYTAGFYDKQELDIRVQDNFAQSNFVCDNECEISLREGILLLIESND